MICNDCGALLSDAVKFCSSCGASVDSNDGQKGFKGYNEIPNRNGQTPVTALFTDPVAPTPVSATTCASHPAVTAAGICVECGNFYCRECLVASQGRNYCRNCSARLSAASAQPTQNYQYQQPGPAYSPPAVPQPYQYPQPPPPYPYQPGYPYMQPGVPYIKRKEPGVALLLSLFFPGLGQIYNGDVGKGIAFMFAFWLLVWIGIGVIFWVWAMIDAYQTANNINYGRRV